MRENSIVLLLFIVVYIVMPDYHLYLKNSLVYPEINVSSRFLLLFQIYTCTSAVTHLLSKTMESEKKKLHFFQLTQIYVMR